jgi:hypothetical protein
MLYRSSTGRNIRQIWTLFLALILASLSIAHAGQPLTLGTGQSVEILSVGPLRSVDGSWSALRLQYQTLTPLTDEATLRKEVDEIWNRFVVDVERGAYERGVITANEPAKGFIFRTNNSFGFIFEKKDGSWRTFESKGRSQAKLDAGFVREFVDRLDWIFERDSMNALLLYMANDWTGTIINPSESASSPQTLDRMKYTAVTHATLTAASSRHHHRAIMNISIADGGAVARVESRETEEMTLNGRQIAGVARSTDTFELRDNVMLWTTSISVIEKQTETKSN